MPYHALLRPFLALPLIVCFLHAQGTEEKESDPRVLKKLEWFQDQKFGLLMHWGTYSQWGIVESWSLCNEDEGWCERKGPYAGDYNEYKKAYENLITTFNPTRFDPARWAAAAKDAGFRYLVFTTKHHDGFCMFDTKQTDYKITSTRCPFHTSPRADITKSLFDAFRAEGIATGTYFSKPDWNIPYYWDPYWQHADRNVNYNIKKYPEKWKRFCDFTYKQIEELMTGYGPIDILWLDGGWVDPKNRDQDVGIPRIAAMARSHQPGLIVVDRAVPGRYENYRTPEQEVPEKPLPYLWETCMTMATSWSYVATDTYKPAGKLIHLLVDIVAKGGNFLLNIGPSPEGELAPDAYARMRDIGAWLRINGEAIYGTRPVAPYKESNICFTRAKDGTIHAIYLTEQNEHTLPATITIRAFQPAPGSAVYLLGHTAPLRWEADGPGMKVYIPEALRSKPPCENAWVLRMEKPGR
ncbi:MAG: alpha-L-fucosidase [Ignavibacteriae bacterium]|nr:alpha-L-fucosidase [Ignavibacteriota bacterium]